MKTKIVASGLLACTVASPGIVLAQEEVIEEIVVTGSLIQGTPDDAALPVDSFDESYFDSVGKPTTLEFMRSLGTSGETNAPTNSFNQGFTQGTEGFNLRGLGAGSTLTLLNGRRVSENTAYMPTMAVKRVEILKDGAAVTYGADAVGGVVNFITHDSFEGSEIDVSYTNLADTDGDYNLSFLKGWNTENGNILIGLEYNNISELNSTDRDAVVLDYFTNPAPWSTLSDIPPVRARVGNAGPTVGFGPQATQAICDQFGVPFNNDPFGIAPGATATCQFTYVSFYNLKEDREDYKLFFQVNGDLNDSTSYHFDVNFARLDIPHAHTSPSLPTTKGPRQDAIGLSNRVLNQFIVPSYSPYFQPTIDSLVAAGVFSTVANNATQLELHSLRTFGFGGSPGFDSGSTEIQRDLRNFRINGELDGEFDGSAFAGILGNTINWNVAVTYSQTETDSSVPDLLGYRVQDAIDGYGGPNCYNTVEERRALDGGFDTNRIDNSSVAPGTNGCQFFNPFASRFPTSFNGAANPLFVAGSEPDQALANWLYADGRTVTTGESSTFDAVMSGELPVELPGGSIGWALGTQWREVESDVFVPTDSLANTDKFPCAYPDQRLVSTEEYNDRVADGSIPRELLCNPTTAQGPLVFGDGNEPSSSDRQQYSFFAEVQLPILDTWNVGLAVRDETFSGGLGATTYKVSTKIDVTDFLTLRASFGDNYSAPPINLVAGDTNVILNGIQAAGNVFIPVTILTDTGIEPETAFTYNFGAIFRGDVGSSGSYRFIVDYFNFEVEDEIITLSSNQIANSTFLPGQSGASGMLNCNATLISFVTLGTPCVQGTTTGANIIGVTTRQTNSTGLRETDGIDITADVSFDLAGGYTTFGTQLTRILNYDVEGFTENGITFTQSFDALGFLNDLNGGTGAISEWRGNIFANYNINEQNFRLVVNYISGVEDERGATTLFDGSVTDFGVDGDDWVTVDFHYTISELAEGLTLRFSAINLADEDPPEAQLEYGFNAEIADAFGRMIRLGATYNF